MCCSIMTVGSAASLGSYLDLLGLLFFMFGHLLVAMINFPHLEVSRMMHMTVDFHIDKDKIGGKCRFFF